MGDQAWVTLATNDSYALGALVVARSLKRVNTTKKLAVMITPGISSLMREALNSEFNVLMEVNVLDSQDSANLALLTRPELGVTFTKLHCWRLTQFSKCVFLDADTLILQNCDELFERDEFSAAPDVGWPDCFNSGVFVFKPSIETYDKLLAFAIARGSFDGGDQGLLNLYFSDWSVSDIRKHLPFTYNMVASATYSYLPAFKIFGANVKIAHFIGHEKPWLMYFDTTSGAVRPPPGQEHLQELLQAWWDIFRSDVHNKLSPDMGQGADDHQPATVVEQVYGSFSHILLAEIPAQDTNTSFGYRHTFIPPPTVPISVDPPVQSVSQQCPQETQGSTSNTSTERVSEFHWVSVAIERHPPENLTRHVDPHPSSNSSPTLNSPCSGTFRPRQSDNRGTTPTGNVPSPKTDSQNSNEPYVEEGSSGLAGVFAKITLSGEKSSDQLKQEEQLRKQAWEAGHIDYMGKDSFENIMKKMQSSIAQAQASAPASSEPPKAATDPSAEKKSEEAAAKQPEASKEGEKTAEPTQTEKPKEQPASDAAPAPEQPKEATQPPSEPPKDQTAPPPEPPKDQTAPPPEPPKDQTAPPPEPPKDQTAAPPEPPKDQPAPTEPPKDPTASPPEPPKDQTAAVPEPPKEQAASQEPPKDQPAAASSEPPKDQQPASQEPPKEQAAAPEPPKDQSAAPAEPPKDQPPAATPEQKPQEATSPAAETAPAPPPAETAVPPPETAKSSESGAPPPAATPDQSSGTAASKSAEGAPKVESPAAAAEAKPPAAAPEPPKPEEKAPTEGPQTSESKSPATSDSAAKSEPEKTATAAAPEQPKAEGEAPPPPPPAGDAPKDTGRRKNWRHFGYSLGLGLSCVAVVVYAIYSVSASVSIASTNEDGNS